MTPIWNWKTALCSGLFRAPAFAAVSLRAGWHVAARSGLTEFVLFAAVSGSTGAAIQRFRHLRPAWLARLVILGILPAAMHLSEFAWHSLLDTPARCSGVFLSIAMSVVAEAFSWYAMRQGAMLTGGDGNSLLRDLSRMPAIAAGFLLWICRLAPPP
ncbi:MAG: hypothetical protein HY858_05885 [Candidatus Solibacter usitatus]|nr:hypothetical protein [Candidatus Solibacter usitatus]